MISIVPAEVGHVPAIVAAIRPADVREFAAMGRSVESALHSGLKSPHVWTGLCDGAPFCMYGVAPVGAMMPEQGRVWLVGTTMLDQVALPFLRRCRPQLVNILTLYPELSNLVAAENENAIIWLRWMGFTFAQEPTEINGVPFYRFAIRRHR